MRRETQCLQVALPLTRRIAVPLLLLAALGGCAGGIDLRKAEVDQTILTGSVPERQPRQDPTRDSDESTIRNAVSAADPEAAAALPWANAATGSRGTISRLVETSKDGRVCRRFRGTRESFDGVAAFSGEACLVRGGVWQLVAFSDG